MPKLHLLGLMISSFVIFYGSVPESADAGIKCQGSYQVVKGQLIGTPYCGDKFLAQVARGYGWKTSFKSIRNNASERHTICQILGHDMRINGICGSSARSASD